MAALTDLTSRELQVLRLVLAGKTNKEIAMEMYISVKTVEFHLDKLYKKLGVQTRVMAGIWAMRQGMPAKKGEMAVVHSE
jgi:DNA-binding NarL/FixJ family response regulator